MDTMDLIDTQARLDRDAVATGQSRLRRRTEHAIDAGRGADTAAGRTAVRHVAADLAAALLPLVQNANAGRPGQHHVAANELFKAAQIVEPRDPSVFLRRVAVIALRNVISAAAFRKTDGMRALTVASQIGNDIADEVLAECFDGSEPHLLDAILSNAGKRGSSPRHTAKAVRKANAAFGLGLRPEWPVRSVGLAVLNCLCELGPFVHLVNRGGRDGWYVEFTPDAAKWFADLNNMATELGVTYMPMIVAPKPWTDIHGGGYSSDHMRQLSLVKRCRSSQRIALRQADLKRVYAAVNAVQATRWRINDGVRAVATELWSRGGNVAGLPSREPEAVPSPSEAVQNDVRGGTLRREHRQLARIIKSQNARSLSVRVGVETTLAVAKRLAGQSAIYFPHQLDYRGRMYPVTTSLTPQGDDLHKGLLTFADGKALGAHGATWLAIHGANKAGFDKLAFEDRIAWAFSSNTLNRVHRVADDPLSNRADWTDADEPWQFLAWCIEWSAYHHDGQPAEFKSHLPVTMDGTCNGLQHFAAMSRDEVTGHAVNLTPNDMPQDVYQRVADVVVAALKRDQDNWLAGHWINFGVDRSFMKRLVMTLPYGATDFGRGETIKHAMAERAAKLGYSPFGADAADAARYVRGVTNKAINKVVHVAPRVMTWLKTVVRSALDEHPDAPIAWTTPVGFPVVGDVRATSDGENISTYFHGQRVRLKTVVEEVRQNRRAHAANIAPNFVQSLDAAHLMLTVNVASLDGISAFAMVHDCYGTHAGDAEALARHLRAAFMELYADRDVLADFAKEVAGTVKVATAPPQGSLDVSSVLSSRYFFS